VKGATDVRFIPKSPTCAFASWHVRFVPTAAVSRCIK
jgi:hypothetical protein